MTHGPAYKTNGKRPVWLKGGDECEPCWFGEGGWYGDYALSEHVADWPNVIVIRLPADHWANAAIEAGYEPWAGGNEAPEDWDGGMVLFGDGSVGHADGSLTRMDSACWDRSLGGPDEVDIIGYKKKESVVSEEVQDWAIEAARLFSYEGTDWPEGMGAWDTVECVKKNSKVPFSRAVMELARLIQKHEPHRKPKDRDEEIAEKWVRKWIELALGDITSLEEVVLSAIKEAKS